MPSNPYIISGTITDEDSNIVSSTLVTAHSITNSERITFTTNSSGQYVLDLANLTSGYTVGDTINVYVRNNGYVGETQNFTLSGEGGTTKNISTANQVTLATIRNTVWKSFRDTLYSGTFTISEQSIYSAMNDKIVADEGYPIVIIFPPVVSKSGITLQNAQLDCQVNFLIEIFHTSAENVKILTDDVENQIWRAQEVWTGLGLNNLDMPSGDYDWWTEGNKKIHRMSLNVNFMFDGVVNIP